GITAMMDVCFNLLRNIDLSIAQFKDLHDIGMRRASHYPLPFIVNDAVLGIQLIDPGQPNFRKLVKAVADASGRFAPALSKLLPLAVLDLDGAQIRKIYMGQIDNVGSKQPVATGHVDIEFLGLQ